MDWINAEGPRSEWTSLELPENHGTWASMACPTSHGSLARLRTIC